MRLPKKSGTNSGTSGFKFPSSLACSFVLFGSDSGCIEAFEGIRKFRGVGGGGTHDSVADAMIGTTGIPYTCCKLFDVIATALTGFVVAFESNIKHEMHSILNLLFECIQLCE